MKQATILRVAALSGMFAVIMGAFGAHGLKQLVEAQSILTWETAARYQFYHALAMLLISSLMKEGSSKFFGLAATMFMFGMLFFCGSLYMLSIRSLLSVDLAWLGPITPIGGLFFVAGWLCLFLSAGKQSGQ
jgi:uncharacterized membrane protein YgdD (TMEM256/DUF423 family)